MDEFHIPEMVAKSHIDAYDKDKDGKMNREGGAVN